MVRHPFAKPEQGVGVEIHPSGYDAYDARRDECRSRSLATAALHYLGVRQVTAALAHDVWGC
jgi:hypothetical protein